MCGALALAEVASAYPKTGVYVFLREVWGRLPAFLFGSAELVIIHAAAIGAVSITFAEYFLRVLGYDPLVAPYKSMAAVHPKFKTPVNAIVLAILFVLATLYLLVNAVIDPGTRLPTISVFVVILLGIPVYYVTVGTRAIPPDASRRAVSETA